MPFVCLFFSVIIIISLFFYHCSGYCYHFFTFSFFVILSIIFLPLFLRFFPFFYLTFPLTKMYNFFCYFLFLFESRISIVMVKVFVRPVLLFIWSWEHNKGCSSGVPVLFASLYLNHCKQGGGGGGGVEGEECVFSGEIRDYGTDLRENTCTEIASYLGSF